MSLPGFDTPTTQRVPIDAPRIRLPGTLGTPVFTPEMFGTPTGTDPAVDVPMIHAAESAAAAAHGTLRLRGVYAYEVEHVANIGPYLRCNIGIHFLKSNVIYDFTGSTLKMAGKPTLTAADWYAGIVFGNGLYDNGLISYPGNAALVANGTWVENIQILGLHTDLSVLSAADRAYLSANKGGSGSVVMVSGVRNFVIDGLNISNGHGQAGVLNTNCLTRNGIVRNCMIDGYYKVGYWIDGPYQIDIGGNVSDRPEFLNGTGFDLSVNADYTQGPDTCYVHGNDMRNAIIGYVITGVNSTIENNLTSNIGVAGDPAYPIGMRVASVSNNLGQYPTTGNIIRNNTFRRAAAAGRGYGFELSGALYVPSGLFANVSSNTITGNDLTDFARALHIGSYAPGNTFQHNIYHGFSVGVLDDGSSTSATPANVVTPNP